MYIPFRPKCVCARIHAFLEYVHTVTYILIHTIYVSMYTYLVLVREYILNKGCNAMN
jgi:hypothetical protein